MDPLGVAGDVSVFAPAVTASMDNSLALLASQHPALENAELEDACEGSDSGGFTAEEKVSREGTGISDENPSGGAAAAAAAAAAGVRAATATSGTPEIKASSGSLNKTGARRASALAKPINASKLANATNKQARSVGSASSFRNNSSSAAAAVASRVGGSANENAAARGSRASETTVTRRNSQAGASNSTLDSPTSSVRSKLLSSRTSLSSAPTAPEIDNSANSPAQASASRGSMVGGKLTLQSPGSAEKPTASQIMKRTSQLAANATAGTVRPSVKPALVSSRISSRSTLTSVSGDGVRKKVVSVGSASSSRLENSGAVVAKQTLPKPSFDRESSSGSSAVKRRSTSSLSAQRITNTLARRKSTTSESRDSRNVPLPQVDVKAGEDVRLDLRGQSIRRLDNNLINLTPKLEFVYLRDNKLSTLIGIEILRRVKVLDLSFNEFKGSGFEPLANCKALQQLYLAGNQITTLSGIPQLPCLEFLSVAQNKLKSLSMATQPRLQVLAASNNKISTFKGFPHLPMLEHLRLEENPILDLPHIEAASILIVGPMLKRFNDRDLLAEEKELSRMYPAHTPLCLREGWDFCGVEEAAESTLQFLVSQWSDGLPPGYTVKKASIDSPSEEDCCCCHFLLEKESGVPEEADLALKYQWYIGEKTATNFVPIEGAVSETYWPKHQDIGCCLKVECTPVLGENEYASIFAVSSPVAPGTGCPKVVTLRVDGELMEGSTIQAHAEVAWCGGTPGKGIVSWLRRHGSSSPVAIMAAEEHEYQLTLDDVGANLLLMYTPVTEEGVKGESHFATTTVVLAAPPCVSSVHVIGQPVEGNTIKGVGQYFGGREGSSKFEWLREDPESGEFKLASRRTAEYVLSKGDVGLSMMFIYTPVNSEGYQGDPVSAITSKVMIAPPKATRIKIIGDIREGNTVSINATVIGGLEDASRVQWFKTDLPEAPMGDANLEAISSSKIAKDFRIPLGAVGYYLAAKYTPVRADGESGEPVLVFSDRTVEMLPPSLNFLSVNGEFTEGETLTASYGYIGGHEGCSQYSWYLHEDENDLGAHIPLAVGLLQYQITKDAINKLVSFKCTPVRDDGLVGESRSTMVQERVRPGSPKLQSLQIIGDPIEGAELQADKKYWGGDEGPSKLQWFLMRPDGAHREIKGATSSMYTVRSEDIDGLLCVSCEPIRLDGAKGPVAVSHLVGPVLPAAPTCDSLELFGQPIEGGCLKFNAVYKGGEKGACTCEWVRRSASGKEDWLSNSEILDLTSNDIGCRIQLVFTPVRKDGLIGIPYRTVSDVVKEAEPVGVNLSIPDCCEGVEVVPKKSYYGGTEGLSEYTWFRSQYKLKGSESLEEAQVLEESMTYTPTLEDVGAYLTLCWIPIRKDGKKGKPLTACSTYPVAPASPAVKNVIFKEISTRMFVGDGEYYGGFEGDSQMSWYRESADGVETLIAGATSKTYSVTEDDYTCSLIFGYTPVREDGAIGKTIFSERSATILPDLPRVQKLALSGRAIEGEVLTALEVTLKSESQQQIWQKYKKDAKYQWSRSSASGMLEPFETLPLQRACSYKVRSEDVGFMLRCECIMTDIFGRTVEPVSVVTSPVAPGMPKMDKLEIEGRGYHTNLYAVRGIYSGGKEGKSMIQWFRALAGRPDLIPIPGEMGRMYEANVDDVGCRLVAVYTPVREDGVEGAPVSASTEPIAVEPEVAKEVKQKLELGAVKFEALRDRDRSPVKAQPQQGLGSLERRVLDVNKKRFKVVKPGSKTSFPNTEIRGIYAPPFHVELFHNDQHRLKIVIDSENEVDLMVQTRNLRDVIVLVLRGLAQRFNSNLHLKT